MEYNCLKIVIDKHIPYVNGIFEPFAKVVYAEPEEINADMMSDADALIIRTRTKVGSALLSGSKCKVVATATIGTDHIDLDWCSDNGIKVCNAPGSNAPAVAQYVFASICCCFDASDVRKLTIGIVGVGNVGKIVERWARNIGMNVLLNDPPRSLAEGTDNFTSLETIARDADIITFHTPITRSGDFPTYHLCSGEFLRSLARKPLIINSARGPVADNRALSEALDYGYISHLAIDCWENEPEISRILLQKADIATPHIAGYSASGKTRASAAAVVAVANALGIPADFPYTVPPPAPEAVTIDDITNSYNPLPDTLSLKNSPESFEKLRNSYKLRKEVGETDENV